MSIVLVTYLHYREDAARTGCYSGDDNEDVDVKTELSGLNGR